MPADVALLPRGGLPRSSRLQHRAEFQLVLRHGRRAGGAHLVLAVRMVPAASDRPQFRLGLAVAREVGHAPARSRLRRLLREAFRALRAEWQQSAEMVVLARRPWPEATLQRVATELAGLALRVRLT